VYAIFRPVAALIMGIAGGLAVIPFSDRHKHLHEGSKYQTSCNLCFEPAPHSHSIWFRLRRVLKYAFRDFLDDISFQLTIGIIVSAVIAFYLPNNFFKNYLGNEFLSMLAMVAVGIPMYICATASIPIAVALMMKGLSPGAAFVFLAVGSATNISFMLVIADVMGKKILSVYLATLTVLSIAMGFALDGVFSLVGTQSLHGAVLRDFADHPAPWAIGVSAVFFLVLLASLGRVAKDKASDLFAKRKPLESSVQTHTSTVKGMTCHNCGDRAHRGHK